MNSKQVKPGMILSSPIWKASTLFIHRVDDKYIYFSCTDNDSGYIEIIENQRVSKRRWDFDDEKETLYYNSYVKKQKSLHFLIMCALEKINLLNDPISIRWDVRDSEYR
jgi:hypothetical protein